ncbi:MAG: hypothetical protein LC746_17935 [Acidobacteria bacterium]|nr:hypothetical protein [Acidobacteriota bacterium]
MSAEQDKVRSIAERIASRLGESGAGGETTARASDGGDELAQLRATLRDLQQRLVQIESRVAGGGEREREASQVAASSSSQNAARAPQQFLSSTYVPATHPSQDRFGINEAVSELVDFFEGEKTCTVEPGGKPCDHCAMCSTRGF